MEGGSHRLVVTRCRCVFWPFHTADSDKKQTPVVKCQVMEIEDLNKEKVIQSQSAVIQMLRDQVSTFLKTNAHVQTFVQLSESTNLMQSLREELKKRDDQAYEARIQDIEARLHQDIRGKPRCHAKISFCKS
jgi:uncharacterized membrane protein